MGLTYATLRLTNLYNQQSMEVNALVDTGATFMCVTEEVALQLGFDITEVGKQMVTLADGHQPQGSQDCTDRDCFCESKLCDGGGGASSSFH